MRVSGSPKVTPGEPYFGPFFGKRGRMEEIIDPSYARDVVRWRQVARRGGQQLLTYSQVLEDEVLPGAKA